MGQSIVVTEKPSSNPGVTRFETNRAITGMGHERYLAGTEVWGERPPDELARRLLARGGVLGVQINSNVVTVDLENGYDATGLKSIIENLYRFYPDQPAAAGDNTVAGAPSPGAADAPEQAAVPADGTQAVADDAPDPDHPTTVADAAETAPTDEPGPDEPETDEPETDEPETDEPDEAANEPEAATDPATDPDPEATVGVTEADPVVAEEPANEPEVATHPAVDSVDPVGATDPTSVPAEVAGATAADPEVAAGTGPATSPSETEPA